MTLDAVGWVERFREAFALVPVPRAKRVYKITLGGGAMAPITLWEWACPVCPWRPRESTREALEARIIVHRCKPRESLNWHPRYRTPPRWRR
jgi:hypothetical protein